MSSAGEKTVPEWQICKKCREFVTEDRRVYLELNHVLTGPYHYNCALDINDK